MPYFGSYLSAHGAKKIKHYKYAATDDSIVLKYITNPLYNKWVLYFPEWLAPNLITLIGLGFTATAHVLLVIYCPRLEGEIPTWLCLFNGFAMLAYQAFDAMDGKHARRTGSGSPLGMLFDHGCDALNTTVMGISMACPLQLGPSPEAALLAWFGWGGFFLGTLEEYYTGELYLGVVNMPNEGLQMGALVHILAGVLPTEFWRQTIPSLGGIRRNQLIVCLVGGPFFITALFNMVTIIFTVKPTVRDRSKKQMAKLNARVKQAAKKVERVAKEKIEEAAKRKPIERLRRVASDKIEQAAKKMRLSRSPSKRPGSVSSPVTYSKPSSPSPPPAPSLTADAPEPPMPVAVAMHTDEDGWTTSFPLLVASTRMLPSALVMGGFVIWMFCSPSDVMTRHPRLMLWTIGLANAKLVTGMQLSHLCAEEYHPFGKTIACLCVQLIHVLIQLRWHMDGTQPWSLRLENMQLRLVFWLLLLSYLHMVWSVVNEIKKALGIYAFVITRKPSKVKAGKAA